MPDARNDVYRELHAGQLTEQVQQARVSADLLLDILWEYLQPKTALDVGCGLGTWVAALAARGVAARGIDGPWLDAANLVCDRARVQVHDLEAGFSLDQRFDIVVCLEVAEHLSSTSAERFVASLVEHSQAVVFSAAIPLQGGHHHVNEQFLDYWIHKFERHGYSPLDVFRGRVWHDSRVLWWLRQNIILFAHADLIRSRDMLRRVADEMRGPVSIVHPDIYMSRLQMLMSRLNELQRLEDLLRGGGTFQSSTAPGGAFKVTRIE